MAGEEAESGDYSIFDLQKKDHNITRVTTEGDGWSMDCPGGTHVVDIPHADSGENLEVDKPPDVRHVGKVLDYPSAKGQLTEGLDRGGSTSKKGDCVDG